MSLFSQVIGKIKDGMSITFNPFNVHEDDDFLVFNTLMDKTKVTFHTNRVPYWVEFDNDEPILLENCPESFFRSILKNIK